MIFLLPLALVIIVIVIYQAINDEDAPPSVHHG